jgi:hypothetical protein
MKQLEFEAIDATLTTRYRTLHMSKAQKLVNRALEVLLRRHQNHLNDQKALVEIGSFLERTDDTGTGTASNQVKLAKETMQKHKEGALTNPEAMIELRRVFSFVAP